MAEYEGARPRPARPPPPLIDERITLIRSAHDEAFLYIDQGLTCDELGNTEQAVHLYVKGLKCIDKAVAQYQAAKTAGIGEDGKWTKVQKMISKMEHTRGNIQCRVDSLVQNDQNVARALNDPPPTYEESLSPMSEHDSIDFDIIDGGQNDETSHVANAREIFKIPDGVQIFFISREGYVSAPSYPSKLAIYKFDDRRLSVGPEDSLSQGAPAFLKIGSWTYPLLPGRSPALHANYGAYIFPDVTSAEEGASVGVIIPDSVTEVERNKFENFLNSLTDYREQAPQDVEPSVHPPGELDVSQTPIQPQTERTSTKVAEGIESAALWLAKGLTKGAEKAGGLLQRGSASLQKKLKPEETPTHIGPKTQKGMEYAMKATGTAVKVSAFVVSKLGQATASLAKQAAPHVKRGGEKILPKSFTRKGPDGTSKLEDCLEVAHGGLKGFGTLHLALEAAARTLGSCLTKEAAAVIKHKYGDEAGAFAKNAVGTGVNTVLTAGMISNAGAKLVARSAVKEYVRPQVNGQIARDEDEEEEEDKTLEKVQEKEEVYLSKQSAGFSLADSEAAEASGTCGRRRSDGTAQPPPAECANYGQAFGASCSQNSSPRQPRSLYPSGTVPTRPTQSTSRSNVPSTGEEQHKDQNLYLHLPMDEN